MKGPCYRRGLVRREIMIILTKLVLRIAKPAQRKKGPRQSGDDETSQTTERLHTSSDSGCAFVCNLLHCRSFLL